MKPGRRYPDQVLVRNLQDIKDRLRDLSVLLIEREAKQGRAPLQRMKREKQAKRSHVQHDLSDRREISISRKLFGFPSRASDSFKREPRSSFVARES